MTSAATEREFRKWKLWGVKKFLDINNPLFVEDGRLAKLEWILAAFGDLAHPITEEDSNELLEDARLTLHKMDTKLAIYGACAYHGLYPLWKSTDKGKVVVTKSDIFKTFGKKDRQGWKLYNEAAEAQARFQRIRDLCKMTAVDFCQKFVPASLLTYKSSGKLEEKKDTDTAGPEELPQSFEITMLSSGQLWNYPTLPETAQTLFRLIKYTSHDDYMSSSMRWDDERKLEEMKDEDMRYLVVKLAGGNPPPPKKRWATEGNTDQSVIGFLSFMITQEEDEDVVYIYEIHISEHFRDCGLGRHLFRAVEHIGEVTEMTKAMLTVFKSNTHARSWYAAREYEVDECSPRPRKLRGGRSIEPDYEILSKPLQERATKKSRT